MAIEPINNRYHGFIFDGENSRDYGVYITEPAVFGSPERDVEYIAIPGRNGDYVRDNGRYKNITVTYKCAIGANVDTDFNNAISDLRNMLGSKRGYKRLSDEINTGEYRMANFSAGIDVSNINPRTGEFEVAFICKPQRFLASGDFPISLPEYPDGGLFINHEAGEASPLLEVNGYGGITFEHFVQEESQGKEIVRVKDPTFGRVQISERASADGGALEPLVLDIPLNADLMKSGDPFYINLRVQAEGVFSQRLPVNIIADNGDSDFSVIASADYNQRKGCAEAFFATSPPLKRFDFRWGTAKEYTTRTSASVTVQYEQGEEQATFAPSVEYIPQSNIVRVTVLFSIPQYPNFWVIAEPAIGESTKGRHATVHIDLETGNAWAEEYGTIINMDEKIVLPDKLPTLPPGETTVTADATFRSASITPRWWKL